MENINILIEKIRRDKFTQCLSGGVFISSLTLCLFSWLSGLTVIAAYFIGIVICLLFRNNIRWLSSLMVSPIPITPSMSIRVRKQCTVCGNRKCTRHKPVIPIYHQTFLPEPVDHSLQVLFETILEIYIERWHSRVSEDTGFEQQLKISIQSAVSSLLHRVSQLDESLIITDRLLPAAAAHFDLVIRKSTDQRKKENTEATSDNNSQEGTQSKSKVPERWPLGDNPYKNLQINWHPATLSRHHELLYLRQLTKNLMPSILPSYQVKCRAWGALVREIFARWVLLPAMDLLADSSILLRLIVHLLENSSASSDTAITYRLVPTLRRFVSSHKKESNSQLRLGLREVIKDTQLLYHFMQFLKKEGAVHVLQFCLDLEKFNDRFLNPELSELERKELFQEAWDIFSLYFLPSSPDSVGFPQEIVHDLRIVLEAGEKNVLRLRNTPPLFQAFEWAFSKLERELLPLFHHSEDFFIMMCGGRLSRHRKRKPNRLQAEDLLGVTWQQDDEYESAAFAEIKDCLTPIDDSVDSSAQRNLNAWRVTVPRVYPRPEFPGSSRITVVMVIAVQRIDIFDEDDSEDGNWTVYRTYADFCALASKLQEFHGEFEQVFGAPIKKPLTRGLEALESWRLEGEEYLKRLLYTPAFQNSDLLHAFLSQDITDFAEEIGGSEISIGKVLRTVRLRRENGQHLEPFVNNLLASSKRPSRKHREKKECHPKPVTELKILNLKNSVFGDNLCQSTLYPKREESNSTQLASNYSQPLQGIFDIVTYLVVRIFQAPREVTHLALALKKISSNFVDSHFRQKLHSGLLYSLGPLRLVQLINMLKDEITGHRGASRSAADAEMKYARILQRLLEKSIPWPITYLPHTTEGIRMLISIIRTPLLNKQLAYVLLDIVAEELIPELITSDETPK